MGDEAPTPPPNPASGNGPGSLPANDPAEVATLLPGGSPGIGALGAKRGQKPAGWIPQAAGPVFPGAAAQGGEGVRNRRSPPRLPVSRSPPGWSPTGVKREHGRRVTQPPFWTRPKRIGTQSTLPFTLGTRGCAVVFKVFAAGIKRACWISGPTKGLELPGPALRSFVICCRSSGPDN
jgi:hypothetical protein